MFFLQGQQKKLKKRNKKLLLKAAADREKKISLVEKTRLDDAAGGALLRFSCIF